MSATSFIPANTQHVFHRNQRNQRDIFQINEKEIIIKSRDYAQVSRRRRSFSSVGSIIQSGIQAAIPVVNGHHLEEMEVDIT